MTQTLFCRKVQKIAALLIGLCFVLAPLLQISGHVPKTLETAEGHLSLVNEHSHAHTAADNIFWATHGHSHDVIDHDHSQIAMMVDANTNSLFNLNETWRLPPGFRAVHRHFPIDHPPRA